jgi:uncharacterized SAM-binding protein YcdF (DUF218 family)
MKRRTNHFLPILFVISFLGITTFIYHEPIFLIPGDFLIIQDELQPADLIHVIAGSDHRTDYAIQLYKLGYAKSIFFTGGWCTIHGYYHGEHAKRRALKQGVPLDAIAADDTHVTSTYSEILRLEEFIKKSRLTIHSLIVVSDPYHMRRAQWAYRQVFGKEITLQMAPVPFALSPYQHRWWADQESRKMVEEEYLKFGYYIARYQLSRGFVKKWLASLDMD